MSTLAEAAQKPMGTQENDKIRVIIDGDWGGDEMQLLAVLATNPQKFNILGATCVFGNTSLENVVKNCGSILRLFNLDREIDYYAGVDKPHGEEPALDFAHGEDGIGGVKLDPAREEPQKQNAVDYIIEMVRKHPGQITLTMTGPASNIAEAIRRAPDIKEKVREIVMMGGCTDKIMKYPAELQHGQWVRTSNNAAPQQGNFTDYAEFNAYNASKDLKLVLESGIPIVMIPMNCTHQTTCTERVEKHIRKALNFIPKTRELIMGLIKAPEEIDRAKTDAGSVMHDFHTGTYLLDPVDYQGRRGYITVTTEGEQRGKTDFTPDENSHIWVADMVKQPWKMAQTLTTSLVAVTRHAIGNDPAPKRKGPNEG